MGNGARENRVAAVTASEAAPGVGGTPRQCRRASPAVAVAINRRRDPPPSSCQTFGQGVFASLRRPGMRRGDVSQRKLIIAGRRDPIGSIAAL